MTNSFSNSNPMSNLALNQASKDFIDCVVNPFNSDRPGRIPDMNTSNTLSFRDNLQLQNPEWSATHALDGTIPASLEANTICYMFVNNYSTFYTNYVQPSTSLKRQVYNILEFGINSTNEILGNEVSPGTVVVNAYDTQNYGLIFGSNTTTAAFDIDDSLVQSTRVVSTGLRLLSTVEQVTDTSQNYVAYFTAGQISMTELQSCVDNNSDLLSLLRNQEHTQIFSNNEGAMSRYNPFQTNEQDDILPLNLALSTAKRTDDIRFPIICATFKDPVASSSKVPLILNLQIWLECALKQPTPLYSEPSPVDPLYSQLRSVMSNAHSVFPLTAKGHTFPRFRARIGPFKAHIKLKHNGVASLLIKGATRIMRRVRRVRRRARPILRAARAIRRNANRRRRGRRTIRATGNGNINARPGKRSIMGRFPRVKNL